MEGYYKGTILGEHEMLRYLEKDGVLCFEYKKAVSIPTKVHSAVYQNYAVSGEVPSDIVEQGEKTIRRWVKKKITGEIDKQDKKHKTRDAFKKNPDFPIEALAENGMVLKGKIVSAEDTTLRVRLVDPYEGEAFVIYGLGAGMAGKYIFDKTGSFSNDALESAKQLLREIYAKQEHYKQHKNVIDLAKKLNTNVKK